MDIFQFFEMISPYHFDLCVCYMCPKELAVSRKDEDMLRESLQDSQKSLDDLNVYSNSLRSRWATAL